MPEPSAEPLRPIGLDLCVSARSRHPTAGCSLGAGRTRPGSAGSSVGSRERGEAQSRDKRRSGHWPARGPRTNCPPSWSRATTSSRWRAWQLARCELPPAGPLRPQTGTSSQRRDLTAASLSRRGGPSSCGWGISQARRQHVITTGAPDPVGAEHHSRCRSRLRGSPKRACRSGRYPLIWSNHDSRRLQDRVRR